MDMGVILQLPPPGMQNPGEAGQIGADVPGIFGQFFDGPGRRRKQRLVGKTLMASAKWSHLLGHGEGEHEVLPRQAAIELPFQPVPAFLVLALGTVAIAAGPVDRMGCAAALATIDRDPEAPRAAVDDGIDYLFVLLWQVGETFQVLRDKGSENFSDGGHAHTSFITALMI
jgi:hypothetical protein